MTKAELVEEVTRVTELPRKESEAVVETIFESIIGALQADDKIEIRGFGSFRTRQRRGRTGRNPKTGRQSGSAAQENPLLQAQQRTEGLRQQPAPGGRRLAVHTGRRAKPDGLSVDALALPLYCRAPIKTIAVFSAMRVAANDDAETLIVLRGAKNFIILNRYPYTSGHVMMVPYAHVADLASADPANAVRDDAVWRSGRKRRWGQTYHPEGLQPGNESGARGGRRSHGPFAHARAAAMGGRCEFHDGHGRNARGAGRAFGDVREAQEGA